MKKLLFVLAFMLVGTFAFANTSEIETVNVNAVIENVKVKSSPSEDVEAAIDGSIDYELSCGISGTLSWRGKITVTQLVNAVMALEEAFCN